MGCCTRKSRCRCRKTAAYAKAYLVLVNFGNEVQKRKQRNMVTHRSEQFLQPLYSRGAVSPNGTTMWHRERRNEKSRSAQNRRLPKIVSFVPVLVSSQLCMLSGMLLFLPSQSIQLSSPQLLIHSWQDVIPL